MVFVCFFVCLSRFGPPARCSFEGCIVRTCIVTANGLILMRFSTFFRMDSPFRRTTYFSFLSLDGATIVAKLRSKIAKSSKIGGKVCSPHFVQIAERFEEKSTAVV